MRKVKRISGGAKAVEMERMLSVDRDPLLSLLMQTCLLIVKTMPISFHINSTT